MGFTAIVSPDMAGLVPGGRDDSQEQTAVSHSSLLDVKHRDWMGTPQSLSSLQHTVIRAGETATHCHSFCQYSNSS